MKFAVDEGIIDLSYVQEQIKMRKREEILNKHPYKIFQGSDGYWRTYLPDDNKKRIMIKKKNREDIEDTVCKYYKNKNKTKKVSFNDAYFIWRKSKDELLSANSTVKYDSDYKRFFENTDFSRTSIDAITEETIEVFIVNSVKKMSLSKKACKTLFGYIKNTMKSAKINKFIKENPMEDLEPKMFYKYCIDKTKPINQRVVSDKDMKKIYSQLRQDHEDNPAYIPSYAVEFASLTGMRVGEISALMWSNVNDMFIVINKSEKYDRIKKEYYIDQTKNRKDRIFPVTDEIKDLLDRVKKVEMQYGFICEWVFANEHGRVHAPTISSCLKNKCKQINIDEKGIHAFRRTLNSKIRCNGVSATVAASLFGHTAEVNDNYYTFDVSSLDDKQNIISEIHKKIAM